MKHLGEGGWGGGPLFANGAVGGAQGISFAYGADVATFKAISWVGKADKAKEIINELKSLASHRYVPPYGIAIIYFGLKEKDLGFEWLERSYEERCFMTFLNVDPVFDEVRDDPRFKSVLKRMGLGEATAEAISKPV